MRIELTKRYIKQYQKLSIDYQMKVDDAVRKFVANHNDPSLKNHALHGKMNDKRSISAANNLRLIFRVEGDYLIIIMLAVGSHNQVY